MKSYLRGVAHRLQRLSARIEPHRVLTAAIARTLTDEELQMELAKASQEGRQMVAKAGGLDAFFRLHADLDDAERQAWRSMVTGDAEQT